MSPALLDPCPICCYLRCYLCVLRVCYRRWLWWLLPAALLPAWTASHTWCDRAAMLVVTCDVTGGAGPLSVVLLPVLLPVCAVCYRRWLWWFCPALLPATLRIASRGVPAPLCWLLPAMSPASLDPCPFCCYLRCYLRVQRACYRRCAVCSVFWWFCPALLPATLRIAHVL